MGSRKNRQDHVILGTLTLLLTFLCFTESSKRSPSYYYEKCAPTICGDSLVQFPIGINPLCRSAHISSSCENGSIFLTEDEARRKYKVLNTTTSAAYGQRQLTLVDVSLLGCAPIPPFFDQDWLRWIANTNFHVSSDYNYVTFFNCTRPPKAQILPQLRKVPCLECDDSTKNFCYSYQGLMDNIPNCRSFPATVQKAVINNFSGAGNLRRKLQEGFKVQWESACGMECTDQTGGRCGFVDEENRRAGSEMCFCTSAVHQTSCTSGTIISLGGGKLKKKLVIAGLGIGSTVLILGVCCACTVRMCNRMKKKSESRGQDEEALRRYLEDKNQASSIETFLEDYASGMPASFSYSQIKKYSNNFSEKLGQGGFGSVFKATLPNGCLVAVKLLDETKQSKIQFLNEVRTVGRIHHHNLVRLLGFCFHKSKRALVYEFMENGSLEKYIHRKNSTPPEAERLCWNQLYDIAVGTARGIAYLHEECQIRILHCDIKPHNILLDRKFQPKVSDFGLAQLVNKEHSHVTLSGGRGTPGYAPPEMWWKKYGPITEKSDVYSFGMVMLEMVGGRRNFDADARLPSEMYFPEWVYKHLVLHKGDGSVSSDNTIISYSQEHICGGEEEEEERRITRTLAIVGLWCIQSSPTKRPSMRKVVQMLEGTLAIEVPPIPFDAAVSQLVTHL